MNDRRNRLRITVRVLGVAAVVAGLALAGYGIYQVWFTGITTSRAQDRLAAEFETRIEAAAVPEFGVPAAPASAATSDAATPEEEVAAFEDPDDVPIMISAADGDQDDIFDLDDLEVFLEAAPDAGSPVGRIVIDAIEVDWIIVEGTTARYLREGPGHLRTTPVPGQPGNAVVSGHRTTNGAPFHDLDQLQEGDIIEIQTIIGVHRYEVVETRIVYPSELWVTRQVPGAWLTLTTCHPKLSSQQRLVVFSQLVAGPNQSAIAAAVSDIDVVAPQP